MGFPGGSDDKESVCNVGDLGLIPGLKRSPGAWQPSPVFLPGESPWTEEPGGLSPGDHKESDMTDQLGIQADTPLWSSSSPGLRRPPVS